jgi:hypothetical protein
VVAQYDPTTYSAGDTTWGDDANSDGAQDIAITGDPQTSTLSDGSASVVGDGVDDIGTAPQPAAFDRASLGGPWAVEFKIQYTTGDVVIPFGTLETSPDQELYIALNQNENNNNEDGNAKFFLRDNNNNDLLVSPTSNPNLDDGNEHTVVWNVSDSSTNATSILIDGSSVSVTKGSSQNPDNFSSWSLDFGYFARNIQGSGDLFAPVEFGKIRLHNQTLSSPTL